mgnify:CR=1 FL=1
MISMIFNQKRQKKIAETIVFVRFGAPRGFFYRSKIRFLDVAEQKKLEAFQTLQKTIPEGE